MTKPFKYTEQQKAAYKAVMNGAPLIFLPGERRRSFPREYMGALVGTTLDPEPLTYEEFIDAINEVKQAQKEADAKVYRAWVDRLTKAAEAESD